MNLLFYLFDIKWYNIFYLIIFRNNVFLVLKKLQNFKSQDFYEKSCRNYRVR